MVLDNKLMAEHWRAVCLGVGTSQTSSHYHNDHVELMAKHNDGRGDDVMYM